MLSKVTINKKNGGLGRVLDSKDGYSGMLIVDSTASTSGLYTFFEDQTPKDLDIFSEGSLYQIEEYFRFSESPLYVNYVTSTTDYAEIEPLQRYAKGECRQIGIYDLDGTFSETDLSALQTIADNLEADKTPSVLLLAKPISGIVESLPDLALGTNSSVQMCVGEDLTKREELGGFVGSVGTRLGQESKTSVGESSAWVEKANVQSGSKYSKMGFVDGSSFESKTSAFLEDLDSKKYNFFVNHVGITGVYPNYDYTSVGNTSDFSSLNFNKVYNKAYRQLNSVLTPKLNSKLKINNDGSLTFSSIKFFENLCNQALLNMSQNEELSGFKIAIDPKQNVLQNDTLFITVMIQPNPTSKFIKVDLGFTISL